MFIWPNFKEPKWWPTLTMKCFCASRHLQVLHLGRLYPCLQMLALDVKSATNKPTSAVANFAEMRVTQIRCFSIVNSQPVFFSLFLQYGGPPAQRLMYAELPILEDSMCNNFGRYFVNSAMTCAGYIEVNLIMNWLKLNFQPEISNDVISSCGSGHFIVFLEQFVELLLLS